MHLTVCHPHMVGRSTCDAKGQHATHLSVLSRPCRVCRNPAALLRLLFVPQAVCNICNHAASHQPLRSNCCCGRSAQARLEAEPLKNSPLYMHTPRVKQERCDRCIPRLHSPKRAPLHCPCGTERETAWQSHYGAHEVNLPWLSPQD